MTECSTDFCSISWCCVIMADQLRLLNGTVKYILYCVVSYHLLLYHIALYGIISDNIVSCCILLHWMVLYRIILYHIVLYVSYRDVLHCIKTVLTITNDQCWKEADYMCEEPSRQAWGVTGGVSKKRFYLPKEWRKQFTNIYNKVLGL